MNCNTATHRRIRVARMAALLFVLLLVANTTFATSSTTFWTSMTPDIQPYGVFHLGIDNYFRVSAPHDPSFFTDFTAPTVGVLPFTKIQMEVGVNYMANAPHLTARPLPPSGQSLRFVRRRFRTFPRSRQL